MELKDLRISKQKIFISLELFIHIFRNYLFICSLHNQAKTIFG